MVKWIVAAILLLPLAEIATFVVVALLVGIGWALALMLATTIAGFLVLRLAGRGQLTQLRSAVTANGVSGIEADAGSLITVLAGILLVLPGFLTDLAGAVLLLGPVRRASAAAFGRAVSGSPGDARGVVDLGPDEWQQTPDRDKALGPDAPKRK